MPRGTLSPTANVPRRKSKTTDAIGIIYQRHYANRPEREASLQEERANAEIARKIYALRKATGLSQRTLADLVGTTASAICRLEDADFEGHSLAMLQRIAAAVNKRVEIRFVSRQASRHTA
jgi:DNA-binding XRE family transcriptional regulator